MADLTTWARELRRSPTDAERRLWRPLRLRQANVKFRRQAVIGRYIVNFVCFEQKLVIELAGGRHAEQQTYDAKRTAWLGGQGFRVLRFWDNDVLKDTDAAVRAIFTALAPPPYSSPTRGEESH